MNDVEKSQNTELEEISIKSKDRVDKFGEVFTPSNIVNDMLNLDGIREYTYSLDKTFLEPSCGNGNFLVEILNRKLSCLDAIDKENKALWEMSMLQALATIYGVDIQDDNVSESRARMKEIVQNKYNQAFGESMGEPLSKSVQTILANNIICGDFLTERFTTFTGGSTRVSRRRSNGLSTVQHKPGEDLILLEWNFDFDKKQVKIKGYTLEAIKNGLPHCMECENTKYNRLADAEVIEEDNSFEALNI